MKKKQNARERREAENRKKTETLGYQNVSGVSQREKPRKPVQPVQPGARGSSGLFPSEQKAMPETPNLRRQERPNAVPAQTPEEETRAFLAWLDQHDAPAKEEIPEPRKKTGKTDAGRKSSRASILPRLNLEDGMPIVSDALDRLRMGLQEMRYSGFRIVKLIHGYGSTGRGGKIRAGVLAELADMKRKKLIRDYIPGEAFGPLDPASRRLTEQDPGIPRDPDYGRMNQGITIVIL